MPLLTPPELFLTMLKTCSVMQAVQTPWKSEPFSWPTQILYVELIDMCTNIEICPYSGQDDESETLKQRACSQLLGGNKSYRKHLW